MNWDQIEGKWKQMHGAVRKQWGKLTDDDLEFMAGSKDQFVGRLQERYGIKKEAAQKQATVQRATLDIADDFVTGNERKADDVLEIAGAATIQGRKIGAADTGEADRKSTR